MRKTSRNISMAFAGLLLAPHAAEAQGATSSPQDAVTIAQASPEADAALTAGAFKSKSSEEQTDILFDKLATIKKNLWSVWYPDGREKPEQVRSKHRQIVNILEKHFEITDPDRPPMAWLDLFNAIDDADDNLPVDQLFLAHIRHVIAEYERAQ